MEIVFHAHHAEVSEHMRRLAERKVRLAGLRVPRVVEATIRFEEDGPTRRVSVALRAAKHHELIGHGEGRYFGPALTTAINHVLAQASRETKVATRSVARRAARDRSRA